MLRTALEMDGPAAIRYPRRRPAMSAPTRSASGLSALRLRDGDTGAVCILAIGKMVEAAEEAAEILADEGMDPPSGTCGWSARSTRR